MKLIARPAGIFTPDYEIFSGEDLLTRIKVSRFRRRGSFTLNSVDYSILWESFMGDYVLMDGDHERCRAEPTGYFSRHHIIHLKLKTLELRRQSLLCRGFYLIDDEKMIGSVEAESFLGASWIVDFPQKIDLPIQLFMIWIVCLLRRRQKQR